MHIKRAIWISIIAYITSFIAGILSSIIQGIDLTTATEVSLSIWYVGMVISIVLMTLFTLWYFKGPKTKPSTKNGFYFGLIAIAVAFAFDAIVILPVLFSDTSASPIAYYSHPLFWTTLLVVLATTTITGAIKQRY